MPETLLQTKLYIPPLRPNLVSRPRLIERLNQGLQLGHRLTLVSAPAGFGKTTLVSEWAGSLGHGADNISQSANRIAWLSLDEGDNDPRRFLAYIVAALNRVDERQPAIGEGAASMLQSPQPPPIDAILISLINDVATSPDRIVLILDDYHSIVAPPVGGALAYLLEHLPPQVHLVISTRDDPDLPMARLRARGQLTELRAADLRFYSSEAAEFLNQAMDLTLSAEEISALETRTEGWIVGLQLAALSMQGKKDVTTLIKSFTGSHRFVLDYLIEEVLEQQSEDIQIFLSKTAILNQLNGDLCDALTGQDNGQEMLEMLESANMFIVPLDEERQWYRYQHLFSDLLRQRLRQRQPGLAPALHVQAGKWYEQNGLVDEAIEHTLRAEDFGRAAQLIDGHLDALWIRGEHAKLRRWLFELPDKCLLSRPQLCIFQALYLFTSGQQDAAEHRLHVAEQALEPSVEIGPQDGVAQLSDSDRMRLRGRLAAIRAFIGTYNQADVQVIIQHSRQALEYLPEQDLTMRSMTAIALGDAHAFAGDMEAAYQAQLEALEASKATGNIYFTIVANLKVANNLREQGRLQRTMEICQQQMHLASKNGLSQAVMVGWLLAVWGEVLAELNDLDGAIDKVKKGVALTERGGDVAILGWSYLCLMRVLISKGDMTGAEEIIKKTERIGRESDMPPWFTSQMAAWQARLWLAQDKLGAVSQWVEGRGLVAAGELKPPPEMDYFWLIEYIVLARLLMAQGRLDETTMLLQTLLEAAETGGRKTRSIEIVILQALVIQAQGHIDQAVTTLERALSLADSEGFIRIFVDEGPAMALLLREALDRGIAPDTIRRLLAAFSSEEPVQANTPSSPANQSDMVEPLSERELEVLQLVAEGLTNRAIASRLFLSQHTVKVHTRNIHGKLGVHSRTQAVAKARALGILP